MKFKKALKLINESRLIKFVNRVKLTPEEKVANKLSILTSLKIAERTENPNLIL